MRRTRVKICGVTSLDDAEAAVALGADAIGFVFAPSKRLVAPADARRIARAISPFATTVGVFRDQSADHIRSVVDASGVDRVQLHGEETPAFVAMLGLDVIKAITVGRVEDVERARRFAVPILFDGPRPGAGERFDARLLAQGERLTRPFFVAGGLDAANVGEIVRALRPDGVDVSSGVEREPGIKDPALVARFIAAVREADGSPS